MRHLVSNNGTCGVGPWVTRLALAACFLAALPALAQTGSQPPFNLGMVEPDPTAGLGLGIPYDRVFSKTLSEPDAPYEGLLRDYNVSFDPTVKLGNAQLYLGLVSGTFEAPDFDVPLVEAGARPEDWKLKIGDFYFNYDRITFAALYSSNYDYTPNNRREDWISIASIGMQAQWQISENLRIKTEGALVWLPFENAFGVDGMGLTDPYRFSGGKLRTDPFNLRLEYEAIIAQWMVEFSAGLTTSLRYDVELWEYRNGVDIWQSRFDEEDRMGSRYVYDSRFANDIDFNRQIIGFEDTKDSDAYPEGYAQVRATRVVPLNASVYMRLQLEGKQRYTREDPDSYLLIRTDEAYTVQFTSERENTRFRPFVSYTASRSYNNRSPDEEMDDIGNVVRAGFEGPASENIYVYADVGYWYVFDYDEFNDSYTRNDETLLYRAGVTHVINPYMEHRLEVYRQVDDDYDVREGILYSYRHTLARDLVAVYTYEQGKEHKRVESDYEHWYQLNQVSVNYAVSPRTLLTLRGTHWNEWEGDADTNREAWRVELTGEHHLTDTLTITISAIRQEEERKEDWQEGRIKENILLIMVTKEL